VLLLALAGLIAFVLNGRTAGAVPEAFVDAQKQLATSAARSIGASANQGLSDLRIASAGDRAAEVEPLLDGLISGGKWRGAAVLKGSSRTLVAARGEQLPIQTVPASTGSPSVVSLIADNGEPRLLTLLPLGQDQLLVATSAVRLPEVSAGSLRQSLYLSTLSGTVVGANRSTPDPDAPEVAALIGNAGRAAAGGSDGLMLGPVAGQTQAAVTYARVALAGQPEPVDLAVVAVAYGPVLDESGTAASGARPREVLAGALAVLAVAGFCAVRWALVRPVRRLRVDLLGVASGNLRTPVRGRRTAELAKIAAAVEYCRRSLTGMPAGHARRRLGLPATAVVTVAALAVAGWSAGALALLANREAPVPDAVVTSIRDQTNRATDALRRSMNDGLADLNAISVLVEPKGEGALWPALDELIATQRRYRSVYLVDSRGMADQHVGRPPLRVPEPPPNRAGIRQQNNSGRVPVIFAQVPFGNTGKTLVGEFDLDHIAGMLGQAPGKVRLVDADFRTISATHGYIAFQQLTGSGFQHVVTLAQRGDPIAEIQPAAGGTAIIAATAVYGGEIGKVGWTVVGENPVTELALPANDLRRDAMLVALLGLLLAGLLLGWHLFAVIRPLRRVARAAIGITAGDRDSVIYPQRQDEIGTIASCLEICRQALTQGVDRLGEARRPRGSAMETTQLMTPVAPAVGDLPAPPAPVVRRPVHPQPAHPQPIRRHDSSRRARIRQGSA
jgi:methyl-accepting chemotaxis protein